MKSRRLIDFVLKPTSPYHIVKLCCPARKISSFPESQNTAWSVFVAQGRPMEHRPIAKHGDVAA
jgi:hypothetical protein